MDETRLPPRSSASTIIRLQSGRDWVDVLFHPDSSLTLLTYNLGPDATDDEARAFADELRHGPKGVLASLDDAGPWVDSTGVPLDGHDVPQDLPRVLPLWEVFDCRDGRTIGYADARGAAEAVAAVAQQTGADGRFLDAELVPVERLDALPAGRAASGHPS